MTTKTVLVAPDGGWGWVIVFATALSNVIMIPIMQGFGLLFKDKFRDIGLSATDATVIINVNSAFGMALGLINGPMLRYFGYRKIALVGGIFVGIGVFATAWANDFAHFIITYSLFTSFGIALVLASFSLALNTYFKVRRNKAMGFASTLTGLGPVFMPHVISSCVGYYGVQGTVIVLAGLSLHSIAAAFLLQPVKWHMKKELVEIADEEVAPLVSEQISQANTDQDAKPKSRRYEEGSFDHDLDVISLYGYETPVHSRRNSRISIGKSSQVNLCKSNSKPNSRRNSEYGQNKFWASMASLASNSGKIIEEDSVLTNDVLKPQIVETKTKVAETNIDLEFDDKKKVQPKWKTTLVSIVHFFDLDLLKDFSYVNLMLGMSIAIFAEFNFSILTPFFLDDYNFTTQETATVMSVIGFVDLVCRFISPFIGDGLNLSPKIMYMLSLLLLIAGRSCIIFFRTYKSMIAIAVFLGVGKGFRTVYMSLVIPSHVPLERLASASGIQMVTNGIILLIVGPVLGIIRDRTGSYASCIYFINFVTCCTLIMWTVEIIVRHFRTRNSSVKEVTER